MGIVETADCLKCGRRIHLNPDDPLWAGQEVWRLNGHGTITCIGNLDARMAIHVPSYAQALMWSENERILL